MVEHDALVLNYSRLRGLPGERDALHILKKVASLVKPLMRQRGWKVGELGEFWPQQQNLLGINYNHGQKILLRLRYATDNSLFLPLEEVVDTMLHELSHIVHGPHNSQFHALWNQLRDEHEALVLRGYTGEGFLSEGRRLGGSRQLPMHEIRRLARSEAEKRARQLPGTGGGHRLGGHAANPGEDMRRVIVRAVEGRDRVLKGCGNVDRDKEEMEREAEVASKNGFKTKAEEDAANEAAIAQALWEMVQEDEKRRLGDSYVEPTAQNPAGNGGWSEVSQLSQNSGGGLRSSGSGGRVLGTSSPPAPDGWSPAPSTGKGWSCEICTLMNPTSYLCCGACGCEKGSGATAEASKKRKATSPIKQSITSGASSKPIIKPLMWMCSYCGTNMDSQWWTCSTCGKMKDKS